MERERMHVKRSQTHTIFYMGRESPCEDEILGEIHVQLAGSSECSHVSEPRQDQWKHHPANPWNFEQ